MRKGLQDKLRQQRENTNDRPPKFSPAQAREIKAMYEDPDRRLSIAEVAKRFATSPRTVHKIIHEAGAYGTPEYTEE